MATRPAAPPAPASAPLFAPIRRGRRSAAIAAQIREALLTGRLRSGC